MRPRQPGSERGGQDDTRCTPGRRLRNWVGFAASGAASVNPPDWVMLVSDELVALWDVVEAANLALFKALRKQDPPDEDLGRFSSKFDDAQYELIGLVLSSIPEVLLVTRRQPGAGPGCGGIEYLTKVRCRAHWPALARPRLGGADRRFRYRQGCAGWLRRTAGGGNPAFLGSLSPLAVPLLLKPRASTRSRRLA
jgi:hypothetical protein